MNIDHVSIALQPDVYKLFRHLKNTIACTLAEYVDNSLQSYLDHRDEIRKKESHYALHVDLTVNWEEGKITIQDNAGGIDEKNYLRAFEPANIPTNAETLNEFGVGMKTASIWLADKWNVRTKAFGETMERYTEFDLDRVTREQREALDVIETSKPIDEHYTIIELTDLSKNAPTPHQMEKIRSHLASTYRTFIRRGDIFISVNGQVLDAPTYDILCAPYYKFPTGAKQEWKKEINVKLGKYEATGYIAILDHIKNGTNGIVYLRRGRVIAEGDDARNFPQCICSSPGTFRYKRIFGEIELNGFDVSFNKNSFLDTEQVDVLMEAIADDIKKETRSLFSQADNFRERSKDEVKKISEDVTDTIRKKTTSTEKIEEVARKIESESQNESNETPVVETISHARSMHSLTQEFSIGGNDYTLVMETVDKKDVKELFTLVPCGEDDIFHKKVYRCKVNLSHSFLSKFDSLKKGDDFAPIMEICKAMALAELSAGNASHITASTIRNNFNKYLS